jgi:class 3 adenylate cyclase
VLGAVDTTPTGGPQNYGARVASSAAGGEIVVSSLVHGPIAQTGEFEFDTAREVELKGVDYLQKIFSFLRSLISRMLWRDGGA